MLKFKAIFKIKRPIKPLAIKEFVTLEILAFDGIDALKKCEGLLRSEPYLKGAILHSLKGSMKAPRKVEGEI